MTHIARSFSFLALGDSYTVGEGVPAHECWPAQLAARLRAAGEPAILAKTGWTTDELAAALTAAEAQGKLQPPYDLVSLQIGSNNQYRGGKLSTFRAEFSALLDRAIELAGGRAGRVLVVSIPDWSATPFAERRFAGQAGQAAQTAAEIGAFNAAKRTITRQAGAQFVDITPLSIPDPGDPARCLAADGLHPSAAMYARWLTVLLPAAQTILSQPKHP